ncbi:MAG: hypothetical protein V3V47_01295, partial [Desulfobacteria bacterium]
MIDLVKRFFSKDTKDAPVDQGKETTHDIRIATCALFLEMSQIDGEFSESERAHIISTLKK